MLPATLGMPVARLTCDLRLSPRVGPLELANVALWTPTPQAALHPSPSQSRDLE
jgi:hypothetical protein